MPKRKTFLRPAKEFPTPLFLVTVSMLTGFLLGVFYVVNILK